MISMRLVSIKDGRLSDSSIVVSVCGFTEGIFPLFPLGNLIL